MQLKAKAEKIRRILAELYPAPRIPLDHHDAYTLLVAVILSAQCTDARVNLITPKLFEKAATPQKMTSLEISTIEEIIRPCGLSSRKASALWMMSEQLLLMHGGKVPSSMEALERLPGVGHKTASVVVSQVFDQPSFPVDTHIHRCAKRWGLSSGKNVKVTEADLKKLFHKKYWNVLHLQIIYFARSYCPARGHNKALCPICSWAAEN